MKKVKVMYAKINNMGDLLNELIIEKVFGYEVIHSNRWQCQTTGIGSSLGQLFPTESSLNSFPKGLVKKISSKLYSPFDEPLQVWSTGFISYSDENHVALRKVNNISSVRGELSKRRMEKILDTNLNIPTGDGGLLASYLIEGPLEKKYLVGIIPHFKERNEPRFEQLKENYKNSIIIDLTEDPLTVVKKMSECEYIISSSLHGLIVADSFGIPNKRVSYTNRLLGDGFKFDDYYSAFNVSVEPFDLNKNDFPTINNIIDDYKISPKEVERKKKELEESFTKYL